MADSSFLAEIQKGKKLKKSSSPATGPPPPTSSRAPPASSRAAPSSPAFRSAPSSAPSSAPPPQAAGGVMGEMQRKLLARQNGESIKNPAPAVLKNPAPAVSKNPAPAVSLPSAVVKPSPPPPKPATTSKPMTAAKPGGLAAAKSKGGNVDVTKYQKMIKAGLPQGAVEQAMRKDNVDVALMNFDGEQEVVAATPPQPVRAAAAVPPPPMRAAVAMPPPPMRAAPVAVKAPPPPPAASARAAQPVQPATKKPPPKAAAGSSNVDLSKYQKMLKAGLPQGAVEQAMRRDDVDVSLMNFGDANGFEEAAPPPPRAKPVAAAKAVAISPPPPPAQRAAIKAPPPPPLAAVKAVPPPPRSAAKAAPPPPSSAVAAKSTLPPPPPAPPADFGAMVAAAHASPQKLPGLLGARAPIIKRHSDLGTIPPTRQSSFSQNSTVIGEEIPLTMSGVGGLCEWLEKAGALETQEITKKSIPSLDCKRLLDQVVKANQEPDQLSRILAGQDIHLVAGALKEHFKALKEPVTSFALYPELVRLANMISDHSPSANDGYALELSGLFKCIKEPNHGELETLMSFLSRVNTVTKESLAYSWGPQLIRAEKDTIETLKDAKIIPRIVLVCLTHLQVVFGKKSGAVAGGNSKSSNGNSVKAPPPPPQKATPIKPVKAAGAPPPPPPGPKPPPLGPKPGNQKGAGAGLGAPPPPPPAAMNRQMLAAGVRPPSDRSLGGGGSGGGGGNNGAGSAPPPRPPRARPAPPPPPPPRHPPQDYEEDM